MNDPAMTVIRKENLPRPVDNLEVAKHRKMALNIRVDSSRMQTSRRWLPVQAVRITL